MKLKNKLTAFLLGLVVLANPVLAQTQQQPDAITEVTARPAATDSLLLTTPDSLAEAIVSAQGDTVYPGQKKPFTEAQLREGENKRYLKRAVLPAAALIGMGVYTIQGNGFFSSHDARDARNRHAPDFSTKVDDYLFFLPVAYLYGFNAFSSQNRHDIRRQTGLLLASGALTSAIVWPAKKLTDIDRPNGDPTAFPSGHTAYAFTIATLVDKEFRHKSPWVSVGSYAIASATGVMRVMNNEHWMADVLAGAGVGIISVNTVYWLHDKFAKDKGLNTAVVPTVLPNGSPGVGLHVTF
ncbi:phosphatase PAP2 family protein [Pontibacter anaerobius]|uniref:Phosphatase PAP2 family protein n=1 Tax=Pontibacter anaerobius TaxID=2993940 RepID=A0ABT3RKP1_9BACT|nr:phosphatase PAP2 family protein [Pontibacter anaerobius]MCX2741943.1 phosphatase PAP2 family protein [Pontibacter anaerobius]